MCQREADNSMVAGAQDFLDHQAANANRAARAYRMFVDEFHDALVTGMQTQLSSGNTTAALVDVVLGLLESPHTASLLAHAYAAGEVDALSEDGAFDA
jgi:hypothetical protein